MKKIPLTQGKSAIVDDDMYEYLSQWRWHSNWRGYATRNSPKKVVSGKKVPIAGGHVIFMHRLINETPKNMVTDHINGDPLDNRRKNLRSSTHTGNMRNRKIGKNISGYKGVSRAVRTNKWRARIFFHNKEILLGLFDSVIDAAHAYDVAALKYYGKFAKTNNVHISIILSK